MKEDSAARDAIKTRLLELLAGRPVVLVGMMGAGKTTVGRRLAQRLQRTFVDSDDEIEKAAGMKIEDIFRNHGEADFRTGEARVIARLLKDSDIVLGTGGGAFMNPETRALVKASAVSIFITAEFELLFARVSRRSNRPLLKTADPRRTLKDLIDQRTPIYREADITIVSKDVPHDMVATSAMEAMVAHLEAESAKAASHG